MPRFILIPNLKPLPFPTIFLNLLIVVSLARAVATSPAESLKKSK